MTSRLLIVGSVALGCVTAAGVGGYLAVRTATHSSEPASAQTVQVLAAADAAEETAAVPAVVAPGAASVPAARPAVQVQQALRPVAAVEPAPRPARTQAAEREVPPTLPARESPIPVAAPPPVLSVPASKSSAVPVHPGRSVTLPAPLVELFEVPANAVIGIRLDTTVSSETARVEDAVRASVTRPVVIDEVTVIPTGAELSGVVTLVDRGGKLRERSRIGIRFTSVTLGDNVHVPIQTDVIYREGEAPAGEATAKIGASAVVGSILGGVFGGKRGAVIGGAAGAAGGTAMVVAGDPNEVTIASGSPLTVRLAEPATFEVER